MNDLKPVGDLANTVGVKMLAYGAPGSGKTPMGITAPRPVILAIEPGMLSLRGETTPAYLADTPSKVDEFFKWWFGSDEVRNFDTLVVDSVSQMAENYLEEELKKHNHGLKAYGEMSTRTMNHLRDIFNQNEKHAYLICKQSLVEEAGVMKRHPSFPGKDLNTKIPHMFDIVAQIGLATVPGIAYPVSAVRTKSTFDCVARDRSGKLNELEPPNLNDIFSKIMS